MTESFQVFVFAPTPDRVFQVGDSVTLTIRAYDLGAAADPDNLTVQLNPYSFDARWVPAVRTGIGAYEATFQIQASDSESFSYYGGYAYVYVSVHAILRALVAEQVALIRVGILLEASVVTSTLAAAPGDGVDVGLFVRANGVLVDADAVYLNASQYSYPFASTNTALAVTHASTGTYAATYTIPPTLNQSTVIGFSASIYLGENYTFASASVVVSIPPDLEVWTHQVSTGATFARIEVYAANGTEWPVTGANVTMRYATFVFPYGETYVDLAGTTDRLGRASFNLTFPMNSFVSFWGNVTAGTVRQGYAGTVYPTYTQLPQEFEVRRNGTFPYIEAGTTARLNYTARHVGVPLADQVVYYYASTASAVVANGSRVTDASGRFEISFPAPMSSVRLDFAAQVEGSWAQAIDAILPVYPLTVEHGDFRIGARTHVTVPVPSGPGPWAGLALLVPYDFSAPIAYAPPAWLPAGFFGGIGNLLVPDGPNFSFNISAPRFLPKDADYLFAVEVLPLNYSLLSATALPYLHVEQLHIANTPPTVEADFSSTSLSPGDALSLDMSRSFDADGVIDAYRVDWGDGTSFGWTNDASAEHAYAGSGDYKVVVQVRDDTGAVATTQKTIHVETGILGMRASDFAVLGGLAVLVVAVVVAVLMWRVRRRPAADLPPSPPDLPPAVSPPPPPNSGLPPETPPPPPP